MHHIIWCENVIMNAVIDVPNLYGESSRKKPQDGCGGKSQVCVSERIKII